MIRFASSSASRASLKRRGRWVPPIPGPIRAPKFHDESSLESAKLIDESGSYHERHVPFAAAGARCSIAPSRLRLMRASSQAGSKGSLADGSSDAYSDIDLHLCVVEAAWDEVWISRSV